ncbi:hypothetical protein C0995_002513 [Termitomyces sp. Mi166|nr:hypothetical protein C0995_002513 [Termitomyces sp. Mi166\
MRSLSYLGILSLLLVVPTYSLKAHDFKTCSQSGFCRRGRALSARAKEVGSKWTSPYSIDPSSITIASDQATFTAGVKSSLYPEINFGLELRVHKDGIVRVRMDEVGGLRKRYDEAASWALISEPIISKEIKWKAGKKDIRAVYGNKKENEVVVTFEPLRVALLRNGKEQVVLNGQGLLHMEHFRNKVESTPTEEPAPQEGEEVVTDESQAVLKTEKPVNPRAWFEGDKEDDYWQETFSSWTDSKPKGPESLSIDINFPNHGTIYGIPQHATRLALPTTSGESPFFSDPYRLYNADVFEYLASSPMSIYGSIPVLHAHSADSTVGIFHAVGSETWIDVAHASDKSTQTHWISESGILDLFLMPGPTPEDIFKQYSGLTGTSVLPVHWSLGYHQCRWNYVSSNDVRTVQKRFDEEDMPVDVFWLDIEYAEDHKYFIWDKKNFPDPVDMINDVAALGRKMVIIVDPHLKRVSDYPVYKKASELGFLVKNKDSNEYEGWCWSGSSAWMDFFNPGAWTWWKTLFKTEKGSEWSWTESTDAVHIWNDMNEVYYDYFTHHAYRGAAKGKQVTVPAALHQIPLLVRGGSIVSTRERPRRSSASMNRDPFTLRVALSKTGTAHGELYLDDGVTYAHQEGNFVWRGFVAEKAPKKSRAIRVASKDLGAARPNEAVDGVALRTFNPANEYAKSIADVRVEKVVVVGLSEKPKNVKVENGVELAWDYTPGVTAADKKEGVAGVLSIKDPKVLITQDWAIIIEW